MIKGQYTLVLCELSVPFTNAHMCLWRAVKDHANGSNESVLPRKEKTHIYIV